MAAHHFGASSVIPAPADELVAWHLRPGALERLTPPWERVEIVSRSGQIADGARVVLRVRVGPFRCTWVALHRAFEERSFQDVQERGPFARWVHTHRVSEEGPERSVLADEIDWALPRPIDPLASAHVERRLHRAFTFRHARAASDMARHLSRSGGRRLHVAVSGASGLVGSALTAFLESGGHRVSRLFRRSIRPEAGDIHWDPETGHIHAARLEGLDAVVHLAGENIASGRWTAAQKARIRDSRVNGTRLLARSLAELERPPRVLVSASAIGYYGDRGDEPLDEDSSPGSGFLPETCREWEEATEPAERAGIRVVRLRTGVVLTPAGGALARMLPVFRLGLGGRLGSGRQFMSWIDHDDLIGIYHQALVDDSVQGSVNAVSPHPVTNAEFTRLLGRVLGRPTVLGVPAAGIRLLLGQMGRELLLEGARVLPARLERAGFVFHHPRLEDCLRFELGRIETH